MISFISKSVTKIFGTKSERDIKALMPIVENIKIEYAEIIDGEISQIYYIEHKLDKKINAVINELWGKIKKK